MLISPPSIIGCCLWDRYAVMFQCDYDPINRSYSCGDSQFWYILYVKCVYYSLTFSNLTAGLQQLTASLWHTAQCGCHRGQGKRSTWYLEQIRSAWPSYSWIGMLITNNQYFVQALLPEDAKLIGRQKTRTDLFSNVISIGIWVCLYAVLNMCCSGRLGMERCGENRMLCKILDLNHFLLCVCRLTWCSRANKQIQVLVMHSGP